MKRLAYACQYYATAQRLLIASSGVTRDAEGKIVAVDGWNCLALVLPYVDKGRSSEGVTTKDLYDRLDIAHGRPVTEPEGAKGTPHADMLAMRLPGLLCPSCGGSPYSDLDGKEGGDYKLPSARRGWAQLELGDLPDALVSYTLVVQLPAAPAEQKALGGVQPN